MQKVTQSTFNNLNFFQKLSQKDANFNKPLKVKVEEVTVKILKKHNIIPENGLTEQQQKKLNFYNDEKDAHNSSAVAPQEFTKTGAQSRKLVRDPVTKKLRTQQYDDYQKENKTIKNYTILEKGRYASKKHSIKKITINLYSVEGVVADPLTVSEGIRETFIEAKTYLKQQVNEKKLNPEVMKKNLKIQLEALQKYAKAQKGSSEDALFNLQENIEKAELIEENFEVVFELIDSLTEKPTETQEIDKPITTVQQFKTKIYKQRFGTAAQIAGITGAIAAMVLSAYYRPESGVNTGVAFGTSTLAFLFGTYVKADDLATETEKLLTSSISEFKKKQEQDLIVYQKTNKIVPLTRKEKKLKETVLEKVEQTVNSLKKDLAKQKVKLSKAEQRLDTEDTDKAEIARDKELEKKAAIQKRIKRILQLKIEFLAFISPKEQLAQPTQYEQRRSALANEEKTMDEIYGNN